MKQIFISYSHKDEIWKDRLLSHLRVLEVEGHYSLWDDRQIGIGSQWFKEIKTAIDNADIAILLVTADFLTSQILFEKKKFLVFRLKNVSKVFIYYPLLSNLAPGKK